MVRKHLKHSSLHQFVSMPLQHILFLTTHFLAWMSSSDSLQKRCQMTVLSWGGVWESRPCTASTDVCSRSDLDSAPLLAFISRIHSVSQPPCPSTKYPLMLFTGSCSWLFPHRPICLRKAKLFRNWLIKIELSHPDWNYIDHAWALP